MQLRLRSAISSRSAAMHWALRLLLTLTSLLRHWLRTQHPPQTPHKPTRDHTTDHVALAHALTNIPLIILLR